MFAGALIAICIRSQLPQDFRFPPVVWDFLMRGQLERERVLEIDLGLAALLESGSCFVTVDLVGNEVPLTAGGRLELVTPENRARFVALAIAHRCAEMQQALVWMSDGFRENLRFDPLPVLSGTSLELLACGAREISAQDLRRVTRVNLPVQRERIFWAVVDQLTSEERGLLLRFSTGTRRIPAASIGERMVSLEVDCGGDRNQCPSASTCFAALHWPDYSSVEIALVRVRVAITYGGRFDRA
jgi:hypothetical protein